MTDFRALCDELVDVLQYHREQTRPIDRTTEILARARAALAQPKPQSLKEQALAVLDDAELDAAHYNILLRALEQLND
jgi:hypothetical protein